MDAVNRFQITGRPRRSRLVAPAPRAPHNAENDQLLACYLLATMSSGIVIGLAAWLVQALVPA